MIADYKKTSTGWVLTCDDGNHTIKYNFPFEYTTPNGSHLMTVSEEIMEFLKYKYNNDCLVWKQVNNEWCLTIKE